MAQQLNWMAPVASELGRLFQANGHEIFLVGGSVRDAFLGRLGHDLDFTTSARPDTVEKLLQKFSKALGGAVWSVGKAFGTIGCRVEYANASGTRTSWLIEVTTYRADSYDPSSRKPQVQFGDTLDHDLGRRDFTVNAMAVSLPSSPKPKVSDWDFHDPYGGLSDLAGQTLRTPNAPEVSFSDDPLRMLRAARFASQLDFQPDAAVITAMQSLADRIDIVSAERVRDELNKIILSDRPRAGLDLLVETGLAERVLPELPALRLEIDEHHRHKDVYRHSLIVLEQAIDLERSRGHQPDLINRWAALLHDIGKPATRKYTGTGQVTFYHHDVVGAKLARRRLAALRFSRAEIDSICQLIELHLRFHGYGDGEWTDSAVRRYVRDAGAELERLHMLTRADCTTRNQRRAQRLRAAYDDLERRIAELAEAEELAAVRPELDGSDIMRILQLPPGPQVGRAYQFLLNLRLDAGPIGAAEAETALRAWWADHADAD